MVKKQKQAIVYVSRCICKIMQSSNINHYINQNVTELNDNPGSGKGPCKLCMLMKAIYFIYVLIIVLNLIQTQYFTKM